MAASAESEASVSTMIQDSGSQWASTSAVVKTDFKVLNVCSQLVDQSQGAFFRVKQVRGRTIFEKLWIKCL